MNADSTPAPSGAINDPTYEGYIITLGRAELLAECRKQALRIGYAFEIADAVLSDPEAGIEERKIAWEFRDALESRFSEDTAWLTQLDREQNKTVHLRELSSGAGDVA
ncbi:hypothetical protein AA101099_1869 [Neoasaia chiangmaiensis NBRC 101099]|uniref:Uncharacterized protein n=1 Tax=Neoasaia chiangmaiensis TaxID=320497 RepID=A0A1U9KR36_9PROT|nr:hypothetical protein [Neoasaia chiangmaiensis]AQS88189.1 hypothetical protein A0U93_09815 [Neoasaia chiangmaiensis]GBR39903.1 hypothetical protein AA101099_1869 [Neoasaia chiangmaiensis NBRC 101099]GEN14793.1 hypothetical protein NCH01_12240 [Neoasaia chiangmaiensis]